MEIENNAVIIDNGSFAIKVGYTHDELPQTIIRSVVGNHQSLESLEKENNNNANSNQQTNEINSQNQNEIIIGNSALTKKGMISLKYPIEHGIIVDWTEMEKLWQHTFLNELRIESTNQNIFLTESILNPRSNREKSASVLFEQFNINNLYIGIQPKLSLYSTGRTNGIILESTEGVTHTIPIIDGITIPYGILRLDLGGRDITQYMCTLLAKQQNLLQQQQQEEVQQTNNEIIPNQNWTLNFQSHSTQEIINKMKESVCYVNKYSNNNDKNIHNNINDNNSVKYELPDGNEIILDSIRYESTEIMFDPSYISLKNQFGISQLINESVLKCDCDVRRMLWNNIVLCGGNTLFNGMKQRIKHDLTNITPKNVKINAIVAEKYCSWKGASILSSFSDQSKWFSKKMYEEVGAQMVHQFVF